MKFNSTIIILLVFFFLRTLSYAQTETFGLSLQNAESEALKNSNQLKSFVSEAQAAQEHADSEFSAELPHLSLEGNYRYVTEVPNLPPPVSIPLGSHSNYSVGPVLSYTLWDTGSARKAYHGLSKLAQARGEEQKNSELQLLFSVRSAYVRVQLALNELRLVYESLDLTRAQAGDIGKRFRAGAAARLDLVTAQREVLNYELQFRQKQAELSSALKDLLAFLGNSNLKDVSHPGPPNVKNVSLVLQFDSFEKLLSEESHDEILPPDNTQPMVLGEELLAQSSELTAASQKSSLFPTVQLSAKTSLDYPDGPILKNINQNTFMATLAMPLFEGGRTRHEAAAKMKEAEATRYREEQAKVNLHRDFQKAQDLLLSLREQQKLAAQDVSQSEEAARLYYSSYKAGKINLIDVQSANVQVLQSKVNATRIDAQILNQLNTLKALSGKEIRHD